jgi:3-(methylthio)propionyl---CoA ligase
VLAQMMQRPLLISAIIEHARKFHGEREIVSRTPSGELHRYSYRQAADRIYRLASALLSMGVKPGDRIATLAWNDFRHFEIYYAVSGIGAVCHTINPRLSDEHLCYIVDHAEDRLLFSDSSFLNRISGLRESLKSVEGYVAVCDHSDLVNGDGDGWAIYEDLIAGAEPIEAWPDLDENSAAALCYTSGTTGQPKGVLYSHRSTVLHALSAGLPDAFGVSAREVILPVVPMFHVNAWSLPYVAPITGASLVLPGRFLDGASLEELINSEQVTLAAGVPTVWLALLDHLQTSGRRLDSIDRLVIGGSAVPPSMIEIFEETYGARVIQAWGMTELSPLGVVCCLKPGMEDRSRSERTSIQSKQLFQGRTRHCTSRRLVSDWGYRQH